MKIFLIIFYFLNFNFAHTAKDKSPEPVTWNEDLKE